MLRHGIGRGTRTRPSTGAQSVTAIYVATTGNNANNGTIGSPKATLAGAAAIAQPGNHIVVRAGTYTTTQSFTASGTEGNPITIRPMDGETVIFDGASTAADTTLIFIEGSYVVFTGFTVRNAKRTGVTLWSTESSQVLANTIHGCTRAGIFVGTDTVGLSNNNVVANNRVYDCVRENVAKNWSSGWAQSIGFAVSDWADIHDNTVYQNYGEGIGCQSCLNASIYDNVVYDCFSVCIYLDNAQNAWCRFNIAYNTGNTEYYRTTVGAARGVMIANEFVERELPSSGITVTSNSIVASVPVFYGEFEANTGLSNSTIEPNFYYDDVADYEASNGPIPT